jgi:hypothetical protein
MVQVIALPEGSGQRLADPPSIRPRMTSGFFLDALVVGCRSLKSVNWLPLENPGLVLDLGSKTAARATTADSTARSIRITERVKPSTATDPNFCWHKTVPLQVCRVRRKARSDFEFM